MPVNDGREFCRLDGVSKYYGSHPAVVDCSFPIAAGEVLGLLGQNGAGKSTLARLIAGFGAPSDGWVRVDGVPPAVYRMKRGIGYLPENLSCFPRVTVRELLLARGAPDGEAGCTEIARRLDLAGILDQPLGEISHGQRRLVGVAYAALGPSRLIILDEPDAGLDLVARDRLRALVEHCASLGSAVVMLSHQLEDMARLCDRVVFLKRGRKAGVYSRDEVTSIGARNLYMRIHNEAVAGTS